MTDADTCVHGPRDLPAHRLRGRSVIMVESTEQQTQALLRQQLAKRLEAIGLKVWSFPGFVDT